MVQGATRLVRGRGIDVLIGVVTVTLYAVAWPTLHLTHQVSYPVQPVVAALAAWPFVLVRANAALGWAISAVSALVIPWAFDLVPDSGYTYPWQVVHIIVIMTLLLSVSLTAGPPTVAVAWVSTVLLFLADTPGDDGVGWAVGLSALVVFGLLVRWLVLSRRQLAAEEQTSELERARRAILEEKARIARDLHDVVAHHMSMVVVQAQSAPYRLGAVSDEARAEFESIGATAREALNEIRGLLGVLRSDAEAVERAPQPGAAQIAELLDGSRRAGIALSCNVAGDPDVLSELSGLTVYRILQESLANAARHCPGAAVTVALDYGPAVTSLLVVNGPAAVPAGAAQRPESSGGSGIGGMRERAAAVGGTLDTRVLGDGGFEVAARVPNTPLA
ncbi:sensor histidine kinase [Rhodococcus sp. SGAir0479]|uniref:sensor histidine kinase n=1 Tax=Rhodococcus sp. SGAir0479 TaxID=2567884 RepID=UPI0010CD027D|nr:histidine kinase [Rhodococcus sp. SGAir0479]QCQ93907.1 sensor histidine kinase [Rhodococcus sp. SGAir0479]